MMKKAQVSVEFLLNFLLMLALISILLSAFAHLLSAAKLSSAKAYEKAKIEEFARTLDVSAAISHERFAISGNYSIGDVDDSGVIIGESGDGQVLGYSIYRMGVMNGEPV